MNEYQFQSEWICADMTVKDRFAPIFKKEFELTKPLKSVNVRICGLGLFVIKINNCLPDDSLLNPAHTQYSKTVLYRQFDVTALCKEKNTVTVELGNGFFNENGGTWNWQKASWRSVPVLMCEIEIRHANGTFEIIGTDESWLVTTDGPTIVNGIYQGEVYDARKKENSFEWKNALTGKAPCGELKKQNMPPVRRIKTMKPIEIKKIENSSYIVTSPEMTTGNISLHIDEPENSEVEIRYGESLTDDGHVVSIGKGEGRDGNWWPDYYIQTDKFISAGEPFCFEPVFSYKGFRYVEIKGLTKEPTAADINIYRIANDVDIYSSFECSDKLINRLHSLMQRTILNNFQWKPTDTPVWEKNGWLGDANCALYSMLYNFNINTYLENFIDIMADCFVEYGEVPVMVPSAGWGVDNSPVWNTLFIFGVKALCDFYGRTDYAKKLYPLMKKFAEKDVKEIESYGWIWKERNLADWHSPMNENSDNIIPNAPEGAEICGSAFIYKMLLTMSELAVITANDTDALYFRKSAEKIYDSFNKKFYNEEKDIYETSVCNTSGNRDISYRQTSNIVPLALGLVPENARKRVIENLTANIRSKNYHLDTGCVGTQFILPVLIDNGHVDTAMKVLTQTTYPSWGYWLMQGDDSAWEGWEDAVRSKNHYFLGTYEEALFSHIAGIRDIKDGFSHVTVKPCLDCTLEYVKAEIRTAKGPLRCEWNTDKNGTVHIEAEIPRGCNAHVIFEKGAERTEHFITSGIVKHTFNQS